MKTRVWLEKSWAKRTYITRDRAKGGLGAAMASLRAGNLGLIDSLINSNLTHLVKRVKFFNIAMTHLNKT
jgi:hypothetical protein